MNKKLYFLLITILVYLLLSPLILKFYCFAQQNLNVEIKSASLTLQSQSLKMVFIKGGSFEMGDVFDEGGENEKPIHRVTVDNFYIAKYEVTVDQFKKFIKETGYKTSAENPEKADALMEILEQYSAGSLSRQEIMELHNQILLYSGAGYWDAEKRKWCGYNPATNWRNPGIEQTDNDPVLGISPDDAMHYCNWLSSNAGLSVAYNLETGEILDKEGNPTLDITKVLGYRLPTEAEWEYAAREGGKKVRFGNGKNVASSFEINFRGDEGDYDYLELSEYAGRTKPVGSYEPNSLGLYDMSGNAWEWVSDKYDEYSMEPQINPYITDGTKHTARGGRWGGDAYEIRVFHRAAFPRNDRCNNTGFRIARSK